MSYIGDFPEDFATVSILFTTHAASGAAVAPSSGFEAADVAIFKNGSATEKTTANGLTMTSPFNGVTGLHCLVIDTSVDTGDVGFWVAGAQYTVVLAPDETVDSLAVVKVIGTFGLELSEVLRPTTAGRQLDVSAGGEAGMDWANIGSPTTVVGLSGTTIKTATDVETDTQDIQNRLPAALTGGRMDSSVGAMANDVVTNAAIAADAIGSSELAASAVTEIQTGLATAASIAALNNLSAAQVNAEADQALADAGVTTTVTGRIDAAISTRASQSSVDTVDGIVDAILIDTAEIGAAGAGLTALGDARLAHLDADVTSRLAAGAYTAPNNAGIASIDGKATTILAGVAAIDSKTTNLPSDPADQSLIIDATTAIMGRLGAPAGASVSADVAAVKTDTAAVKTKTDDLTFTVAGAVDANVSHVNEIEVIGTGTTGDEWNPAP